MSHQTVELKINWMLFEQVGLIYQQSQLNVEPVILYFKSNTLQARKLPKDGL